MIADIYYIDKHVFYHRRETLKSAALSWYILVFWVILVLSFYFDLFQTGRLLHKLRLLTQSMKLYIYIIDDANCYLYINKTCGHQTLWELGCDI